MNEQIDFISINIEGDKHLSRITKLIRERPPDVACFQEVLEKDINDLAGADYDHYFSPMATGFNQAAGIKVSKGILTMWKRSFALLKASAHVYFSYQDAHDNSEAPRKPNERDRIFLVVELECAEHIYRIGNTHFIWTPDGSVSDEQRTALANLLPVLDSYNNESGILFSGDFNAPRGGEIFTALAERYQDNIPAHVTTTIDQELHRKKGIQLVVDGLFSSPEYAVSSVELVSGVSDHHAVIAKIARR